MRAVTALARAELRARGWSLLAIGLLLGLVGGAVLGAAAVGVRTATAYPRLVEATGLDDARVFVPADQPDLVAQVPELPGVATAWTTSAWVARVEGPVLRYVSVGAGTDRPEGLVEPVLVEGREPAPDAADELLLGEPFAEASGLRVGDTVTLRLLTLQEISQFAVGFGDPDGATVRMRVVGIGRMTYWSGALSNTLAGPAFARAHSAAAAAHPVFLRLDGTPGAPERFAGAFTAAAQRAPASVVGTYLPPRVELPTSHTDPAVRTAEGVLTTGLAVFALVLAAGGLLVVGQALARRHAGSRATQRVESALGMTAVQRVGARVLAAVPAALLAGVLGAALALASGALPALGSQQRFEPEPGFLAPWPIAAGGAVVIVAVLLAGTAAAAALAGRPHRAVPPAPARTGLGGRRPALLVGTGLALHGRLRGPLTVLGAGLLVAGVVAAATVGAGLARLVDTPARYGQNADLTLVDAREDTIAALVADDRVAALDVVTTADVALADGTPVAGLALEHRLGALPVETVSGRTPARAGEVALGPRLASRLGVVPGDALDVRAPGAGTTALTVTGVVVVNTQPSGELGALGETLVVTPDQLAAIASAEPLVSAAVAARPGRAGALFDALSHDHEVFLAETPDEIRNLRDLLLLPELLAAALALVGTAGLVHAVVTATRRHAATLAVLAALGATPRQVRRTVAVLAVSTALPALLVGVPLGLAVGRVLWWEIATGTGVAGDVALPGPLLAGLAPAVLLAALLAAGGPALRATRTPPAALLRGE